MTVCPRVAGIKLCSQQYYEDPEEKLQDTLMTLGGSLRRGEAVRSADEEGSFGGTCVGNSAVCPGGAHLPSLSPVPSSAKCK